MFKTLLLHCRINDAIWKIVYWFLTYHAHCLTLIQIWIRNLNSIIVFHMIWLYFLQKFDVTIQLAKIWNTNRFHEKQLLIYVPDSDPDQSQTVSMIDQLRISKQFVTLHLQHFFTKLPTDLLNYNSILKWKIFGWIVYPTSFVDNVVRESTSHGSILLVYRYHKRHILL